VTASQSPTTDDEPTVRDSTVGYIDSALPVNQLRLRFDASYGSNRPNRAEFFWAQGNGNGPGVPRSESNLDFQQVSTYLEFTPFALPGSGQTQPGDPARFSAFLEAPICFLNPDQNSNATGFGDLNAGFKLALLETPDSLASFQLRTFFPTGNPTKGLGTNHFSLEPALLLNERLAPWLTLEGEVRYWTAVGGTDFAGDLVRYGLGLSVGQHDPDGWWVRPVTEFIGWTVLSGKESGFLPPDAAVVESARGDTIINVKLGARAGFGNRIDVYAGYGRALTGDVWYKDTFRVECRLQF